MTGPIAHTPIGDVRGTDRDGIAVFRGITYARAKNDSNATGYTVGTNHGGTVNAGSSSSVIITQIKHSF